MPEKNQAWDDFVLHSPSTSLYHLSTWKELQERTFRHPTYYLYVEDNHHIVGVLPLVYVKSMIFGKSLVSMPFVNYGGIVAENDAARKKLLGAAIDIVKKNRMGQLELRHQEPYALGLARSQSKVSMILDLPESSDKLWATFKSKLRSQIRKPMKEGFETRFGGREMVKDFYQVFAVNMRDLGSPVHGKKFFNNIMDLFPERTRICVVYSDATPIAAGFLIGYREQLEIPWASAIRTYNRSAPNMLLYWKVLEYACDHGFKKFDFGRSTLDTGTYRFKAQWGARPKQLYWDYWSHNPDNLKPVNHTSPGLARMVALWKKLPVGLTRLIGPAVRKNITA